MLIRWGDPVVAGAPAFDPTNQTAAAQEKQFGYNNDFIGLHPLPAGSTTGDRFLMVVNHEYTDPNLMFAGLGAGRDANLKAVQAAGRGRDGRARRLGRRDRARRRHLEGRRRQQVCPPHLGQHADATSSGPAAGHDKLKTSADPTGTQGARHVQQLRRRQDAVGHLADLRGELQRLLRRRRREACPMPRPTKRYGVAAGRRYAWAQLRRPLQPRQGAERAQPLRLDRRDRPLRSAARRRSSAPRSAASSTKAATYALAKDGRVVVLHRRRRALRVRLQVRHRAAVEPQRPRRQPGPAGRRHALRRPLRRRRQGRLAAAGPWPGAADRGERLHQPGRRGDRCAPRRPTC